MGGKHAKQAALALIVLTTATADSAHYKSSSSTETLIGDNESAKTHGDANGVSLEDLTYDTSETPTASATATATGAAIDTVGTYMIKSEQTEQRAIKEANEQALKEANDSTGTPTPTTTPTATPTATETPTETPTETEAQTVAAIDIKDYEKEYIDALISQNKETIYNVVTDPSFLAAIKVKKDSPTLNKYLATFLEHKPQENEDAFPIFELAKASHNLLGRFNAFVTHYAPYTGSFIDEIETLKFKNKWLKDFIEPLKQNTKKLASIEIGKSKENAVYYFIAKERLQSCVDLKKDILAQAQTPMHKVELTIDSLVNGSHEKTSYNTYNELLGQTANVFNMYGNAIVIILSGAALATLGKRLTSRKFKDNVQWLYCGNVGSPQLFQALKRTTALIPKFSDLISYANVGNELKGAYEFSGTFKPSDFLAWVHTQTDKSPYFPTTIYKQKNGFTVMLNEMWKLVPYQETLIEKALGKRNAAANNPECCITLGMQLKNYLKSTNPDVTNYSYVNYTTLDTNQPEEQEVQKQKLLLRTKINSTGSTNEIVNEMEFTTYVPLDETKIAQFLTLYGLPVRYMETRPATPDTVCVEATAMFTTPTNTKDLLTYRAYELQMHATQVAFNIAALAEEVPLESTDPDLKVFTNFVQQLDQLKGAMCSQFDRAALLATKVKEL